jgi:hypothetical protein
MAYTRQPYDYREDRWEYKIVRAPNGEFGQREHLRALLDQERRAGWMMVEKYNDWQVRFKRPRNARQLDDTLPSYIDPYRTIYTTSHSYDAMFGLALAAGMLFFIVAMVILVILAVWS